MKSMLEAQQQVQWEKKRSASHLGAIKADDPVHVARAVVEVGDGDSVLAAGQPVLLGVGVDLEDVCPRAVDGLLPEGDEEEVVNLLVPQYQRLTEAAARAKGSAAAGGVASP